jgi:hypothetical protein
MVADLQILPTSYSEIHHKTEIQKSDGNTLTDSLEQNTEEINSRSDGQKEPSTPFIKDEVPLPV